MWLVDHLPGPNRFQNTNDIKHGVSGLLPFRSIFLLKVVTAVPECFSNQLSSLFAPKSPMYMMRAFLCFATALVSLVTAASNPTFVLVPGAWHSPVHYNFLISHLESAGFPTVAKRLPSVNSINPKAVSVTTDATFIRNQILIPLLDQGKNVVLVMHSYGGSPGAAAAKGLSKVERIAADQPGGIIGLIFIAALLVPQGVSLKQAVGGKFNDWVVVNVCLTFIKAIETMMCNTDCNRCDRRKPAN